jgi:c-di-GMP-binding flagellar brake protein YcgR
MKTQHDSKRAPAIVPERRRRPRYWLSAPMTIRPAGGSAISGLSVDISEGGMSVMSGAPLNVGETVDLEPVEDGRVSAVVRHKLGQMYGLEFVDLSAERAGRIAESCQKLAVQRAYGAKS